MSDIDFSKCDFIKENMQFYTYYDFCDNCVIIKRMFKSLDRNAKLFYKWYVYANVHMGERFKNSIWDFLNCDDEYYYINLIKMKRVYSMK